MVCWPLSSADDSLWPGDMQRTPLEKASQSSVLVTRASKSPMQMPLINLLLAYRKFA